GLPEMRMAKNVIDVAARSMSECAASERIASDPEASPTTALARVSPADTPTDPSATRSLTSCIGRLRPRAVAGRARAVNNRSPHEAERNAGFQTDPDFAPLRRGYLAFPPLGKPKRLAYIPPCPRSCVSTAFGWRSTQMTIDRRMSTL